MTIRKSFALSSTNIVTALGFTPASSNNIGAMAAGSAAAPSLSFATATTTGFFQSAALSADYAVGIGFASGGKQVMTLHYGQDTSGGTNADAAVLRLGTGQAITKQNADVYIGTIRAPSVTVSGGGGAHFIMVNIGSMSATFDATTYTGQFATIEADKTDAYSAGGAVTLNDTAGMRVVGFTPRDAVTIVHNKALVISPAVRYDTGSSTSYSGIYVNALNITGIGTAYGLRFADNPAGGSIASDTSVNLSFKSSLGAGGQITLTAAGGVTVNSGVSATVVNLQSNSITGFQVGTTSGEYWAATSSGEMKLIANASGGGGNVNGIISSGGTGSVTISTNAGAVEGLQILHRASGVNKFIMQPGSSGVNARFYASAENLLLGTGSALATGATAGYTMIGGVNGISTGAPTGASAGAFAIIYDYANNKLGIYNSGWKWATFA